MKRTILALLAALALAGCSNSTAPGVAATTAPTSAPSASTSTSVPSSTTTSSKTSPTTTSAVNPLVAVCAVHCPALKAIYDLPSCHTDSTCNEQGRAAIQEISALAQAITDAGLSLSDYPDLHDAVNNYLDAAAGWVHDAGCYPMVFDGSDRALGCVMELLTLKTNAGTTGLVLDTVSIS